MGRGEMCSQWSLGAVVVYLPRQVGFYYYGQYLLSLLMKLIAVCMGSLGLYAKHHRCTVG
jgi:hypothetical protein